MKHIAIIGNGISGVTAARHIRKQTDYKITLISSESTHFFSRTALMYVYMGHMKFEHIKPYEDHFWEKNKIELKSAHVERIDAKKKQLHFSNQEILNFDELIIATGSKPRFFNWKGQDLEGVQGLYSWQDLELMQKNTQDCKRAVVVGGGLIGVEMAEMLISRGIAVTFLVRDSHFWGSVLPKEEGNLVSKHIAKHGVDLRFNTELAEIVGDENGKVKSIKTNSGEEINCDFVGITTGVEPNIDFVKQSGIACSAGVLVNEYLETSEAGVYAIGDCAEFQQHPTNRGKIEQVWYTGKMMGETVAQSICGNRTAYKPGVWFNSAKFFDLEYQTYGRVSSKPDEDEVHFYWEAKEQEKCLKFAFHKQNLTFLGINAFGIRLRHEVMNSWIKNQETIDAVIQQLGQANFDPEFYPKHEKEVQEAYQKFKAKRN
tara:strand:- start:47 stop:1336 length:1290 start_codon:yes stop_codon:yes gene_type:complete